VSDTIQRCEEIQSRLKKTPFVLIVEDSEIDAKLLQDVTQACGAKTAISKTVVEARNSLETIKFDLVFLDLSIPGEDGIALLEWLKAQNIHTPVAVVTGHRLSELGHRADRFDILTIMPKPVSVETIRKLLIQLKLWTT